MRIGLGRFVLATVALCAALAIGSHYAGAHGYGPIEGHTQMLGHVRAPDGGTEQLGGNGRGGGYVEEQGPITRTTGCVEAVASTVGDGGTVAVVTGQRYELTVGSTAAVRLANGTACVGYTIASGGVGKRVNEGTVRYWTAPVGAGNDGGTAVYTVCAESAGGWVQFCPAP